MYVCTHTHASHIRMCRGYFSRGVYPKTKAKSKTYTYTHAYTAHIHVCRGYFSRGVYPKTHIYPYIHIHIHTCVQGLLLKGRLPKTKAKSKTNFFDSVWRYVYTYFYVYLCMCVCVCVCVCIYIYIYIYRRYRADIQRE